MHRATTRKHWLFFVMGFAAATLIASSLFVFAIGGMLGVHQPSAQAQAGPPNFVPPQGNARFSSMRYADQYFLHDHWGQTQQIRKQLAAAHVSPRGTTASSAKTPHLVMIGGGAETFNSDPYVFAQNGDAYAIDPATVPGSGQQGIVGVVGFNDYRGFYLGSNTYSGYAVSKNVSCGAGTCAQLLKDGWLPEATDPLCTDGSLLEPDGDPAVTAVNGTFYYATLAIAVYGSGSSNCAATNNDGGIIVAESNANLENPTVNCADSPTFNNCWTSVAVSTTRNSSTCSNAAPGCLYADKPSLVADPASGSVEVAWDLSAYISTMSSFSSTTVVDATSCNAALSSCATAAQVSQSPAHCQTSPCDDTYAPYLALWHNPGSGVNDPILTYVQYNFDCSSFPCNDNTDLHLADLNTSTDQIFTSLPPYLSLGSGNFSGGIGQLQIPIQTQVKVAADDRSISNAQIYVAWDQCIPVNNPSDGTQDGASYFSFGSFGDGGICVESQVKAENFTSPTATPAAMTVQGGYDQFMPSIVVDQFGSGAGEVALAYYSTQSDAKTHTLYRPYAGLSAGGTAGFNTTTYDALLTVNARYSADPQNAHFQFAEAYPLGDYMAVGVANGGLFVNFTATFAQKYGPDTFGIVATNQQDNYLCYIQPGTAYNSQTACSMA